MEVAHEDIRLVQTRKLAVDLSISELEEDLEIDGKVDAVCYVADGGQGVSEGDAADDYNKTADIGTVPNDREAFYGE